MSDPKSRIRSMDGRTVLEAEGLPETYVPKGIRQPEPDRRDQIMYACGWETVWRGDALRASYGMFAGPFPDLEDALDVVPEDNSIEDRMREGVILRYNRDGTDEVLYRWVRGRSGPSPITPHWKREKGGGK